MKRSIAHLSALASLFAIALPAAAGDMLDNGQIAALVKGNTVHATHLKKGFDFTVYFDADGKTAIRKQNGTETETGYRIEDGKHCIHWKGKDRCAGIRDNGDGSYSRINAKGKEVVTWNKVVSGKDL